MVAWTVDTGRRETIEAELAGAAGIATWPSAAAPANGISIAEAIRYIVESQLAVQTADSTANVDAADVVGNKTDAGVQAVTTTKSVMAYTKAILDILAGTTGISTFPAAAAAGNGVSLAEVLRYVSDSQLAVQTADSSANVDAADVVGNKTDASVTTVGTTSSLAAYAKGILTDNLALPRCVEKSDGAVLSGNDPLFTITGGPVKILEITGIVTTIIGAGTTNVKLQIVTTDPSATVDMNAAAVDIDADAVGTSYQTINTTGVFTPVTAGYVKEANSFATLPTTFLAPIGSIQLNSSAARTGNIKWYLRYVPLSPLSRVAAAA